jgi:hypothetical protein
MVSTGRLGHAACHRFAKASVVPVSTRRPGTVVPVRARQRREGIYFVGLEAGSVTDIKKLLLVHR